MANIGFQPGVSGNPGGRPSIPPEVKELARKYTPAAIRKLAKIMEHGESEMSCVAAAKELLDRAWGKPAQAVTNEDGSPLQIQAVLFAALREGQALPAPYVDAAPQQVTVETVKP